MMIRNAALPAWQAQWIDPELPHDPETRQPASYLRRRFTVGETGRACFSITCHGLYAAFLNGCRVGDFVLAPGTGDYRRRLYVQCYDVTSLLRPGENELTVVLGDGWYRGCIGVDGLKNYYGNDLALLCQLDVNGKTVVCSDESWEASQNGPVRENDLELGETFDARLETITGWHPVTVRDFGFGNLAPTETV
ncbi:MAG: alpha-L-rhamnosidase N-terminal domain-containing protein, partial [Clostridia bacterium]|nr:alpha-L-rhamnosidase N-terminal domain-containing protein [Clostridia bacterium]